MAKISTAVNESVFKIDRWLGVNQSPEGESRLRYGEAADMRNFRITAGGALRKRPGSKNIAGLMNAYNVIVEDSLVTLATEYNTSVGLTMYPRTITDSVGKPISDGPAVTVNYANSAAHEGYFYVRGENLFAFSECAYTPRTLVKTNHKTGYALGSYYDPTDLYFLVYDSVAWNGTSWTGTNPSIVLRGHTSSGTLENKYVVLSVGDGIPVIFSSSRPAEADFRSQFNTSGRLAKITSVEFEGNIYGNPWYLLTTYFDIFAESKYEWKFHSTHSEGNGADSQVRGIWSGFVGGREVLCAACNGYLWELFQDENGAWSKTACGEIITADEVFMFGFDKKLYLLNGSQYKVWDGTTLLDVEGYRPLVSVANVPGGGGTGREQVNKLNGLRRAWFSPDGTATTFQLPEKALLSVDYVKKTADGTAVAFTANLETGIVTITPALPNGTNAIEIGWTYPTNFADTVRAMKYAEIFNGMQDSRVFLYGDGSNKAFYSGLDYNGKSTAEYFPDLNEMAIGDANAPITALLRHYGRLMAFKLDSAYSVYYDTLTLEDSTVTAAFYVTPVNRDIGNCAPGQARLVDNRPRTLDGRSVIEWKATVTSSNVAGDQRNAERISQRIDNSIRGFALETAKTFYDKLSHEYYIIGSDGTALINGVDADAWYIYTGFDALCLIRYRDELYYGTADGWLRHCSDSYFADEGAAIDAYWESGSMSFDRDFKRKYSAMLWVGIKPENNGYLKVTAETDQKNDFAEYAFSTDSVEAVPTMNRIKLKAKQFTYYKLILSNNTVDTTATVVSADIRVRGTGYVR